AQRFSAKEYAAEATSSASKRGVRAPACRILVLVQKGGAISAVHFPRLRAWLISPPSRAEGGHQAMNTFKTIEPGNLLLALFLIDRMLFRTGAFHDIS